MKPHIWGWHQPPQEILDFKIMKLADGTKLSGNNLGNDWVQRGLDGLQHSSGVQTTTGGLAHIICSQTVPKV